MLNVNGWRRRILRSGSALLFVLAVSPGMAEEREASIPLGDLLPVSEQELSGQRGREDLNIEEMVLQLSNVNANGTVGNNVLSSQSTGDNLVESGAFDGAAGVVFAVQNSGNNVLIQNTTLINVMMSP